MISKSELQRRNSGTLLAERPERPSLLSNLDAASIAWRSAEAHADADIEGLARDPEAEALVAEMDRDGLSLKAQRQRLVAYYRKRASAG